MNFPRTLGKPLLDGRYHWGHAARRSGRYGARSIRVVIYPPSSTRVQRRIARLHRFWLFIAVGLIIGLGPAVARLTATPLVLGLLTTLVVVCVIGSELRRAASPVTAHSVELFGKVSQISPDDTDRNQFDHVVRLAENLHEAEAHLTAGRIGWERYRTLWAEHYRRAHAARW